MFSLHSLRKSYLFSPKVITISLLSVLFLIAGFSTIVSIKPTNALAETIIWSYTNQDSILDQSNNRQQINQTSQVYQNQNANYNWSDCNKVQMRDKILVCNINNSSAQIYYTQSECIKSSDSWAVTQYAYNDANHYQYDFNSGDYCRPVGTTYYNSYSDAQKSNPQTIYINVNINTNQKARQNTSQIRQNTIQTNNYSDTSLSDAHFNYTPPSSSDTYQSSNNHIVTYAHQNDVIVPTETINSNSSTNSYSTGHSGSTLPSYDWVDYGKSKSGNKQDLSLTTYKGTSNQELINLTNNYANKYGYSAGDKNMLQSLKNNNVLYCGSSNSSNCSDWAIDFNKMKNLAD